MEKISNILPANPRISSVDHRGAATVRPGAPGFGAPEGKSAGAAVQFSKSDLATKLGKEFTSTDWKVRDLAKAGMVDKLSQSFFTSRLEDTKDIGLVSPNFRSQGASALKPASGEVMTEEMASKIAQQVAAEVAQEIYGEPYGEEPPAAQGQPLYVVA